MSATYSATSPYYGTPRWGQFLDLWKSKTIPADPSDALYEIDTLYNFRPDLLAFDIYQDASLWWVFAIRNPDVLLDPIYSFVSPNVIYVPTGPVIRAALGI